MIVLNVNQNQKIDRQSEVLLIFLTPESKKTHSEWNKTLDRSETLSLAAFFYSNSHLGGNSRG
jgi:hypothetical protein